MIFTFRELTRTLPLKKSKGKGAHKPKAQTAGAYPGFLSMKHAEENCDSNLDSGSCVSR